MINHTVFLVGAITLIVLALYHAVGFPLARDLKFFLPMKAIIVLSPIIIVVALSQAMMGPWGWPMYLALVLAIAYMALFAEALRFLLPKSAPSPTVHDRDVVPDWRNHVLPEEDRFKHG